MPILSVLLVRVGDGLMNNLNLNFHFDLLAAYTHTHTLSQLSPKVGQFMHVIPVKHAYIARLADGSLKQPFQEFLRQCSYYKRKLLITLCKNAREALYYFYYYYPNYFSRYHSHYWLFVVSLNLNLNYYYY